MFLLTLSVNLKLDEVTPREVHLSITQPDEAPWADYVLEIAGRDGPEILEPVKAGDVTKVSIDRLEPGTPYRVRVRPVKDKTEDQVWIDEATFDTPGEGHTGSNYNARHPIFSYQESKENQQSSENPQEVIQKNQPPTPPSSPLKLPSLTLPPSAMLIVPCGGQHFRFSSHSGRLSL